ncbi:MAG: hypothetical protein PHO37_12310 [Kiritimatiellae bacterium]|nr:hypothetical protein [Kiritimatiellia bacterium]
MKNVSVLGLVVVVCAAVLLGGCGKGKKKISERMAEKLAEKAMAMRIKDSQGEEAKVNIADGKMSIKTKDGETTFASGEGASLPADFPKDVYVFKGATIQMAMKVPDGFMLSLKVGEKSAKLAEIFDAEMTAQGWTQEGSFDMGASRSLTFKKGERQATAMLNQSDEATEVMLTVTAEKLSVER